MEIKDCLQELRKIKDAAFATVDKEGNPRVRIIDVMMADKETLYFCTARGKDFYQQLSCDNRVAVTGLNKDFQMFRLRGRARRLPEEKMWIDRIFENNPSMNTVYPNESRYILVPFVIEIEEMEFFDLGTHPIHREVLSPAHRETISHGFHINDSCIGCGRCKKLCPQQCISEGSPFSIRQEHCLHCGLCFENCPVKAIQERSDS